MGQQQVIKIERVGNEWRIVEPADTTLPNYVQFDSTTGKITIDPSEVGGDGKVNVSATEPGKIDSSQKDVTNNTQLTAEKPDVEPTCNGGKTVSPKNNTKEMSINFTNEQGQPQTVVVEKVNGVWQPKNGGALPKGVDLNNQTGQVTLDPQLLGDSTPISVEGKEDGKVDAVVNGVTEGDANAAPPPVKALADGGIEFSPAVGNTEVYAEFFNEYNVKQTVTIVQDANGNWVLKPGTTKPEGVTINSNGTVTVDSQAIQDKSKITAIGREAGKNEAPNDATSSAVDTAPAQPKVLPKESGGIDIIPAAGNDEVAVEIPNGKGGIDPISIKKVGNDWLPVVNGNTLLKSENGNYAELPKGNTGTDPDKTVTVKKVGDDWVPVVDGQPLPKSTSGEYPQLPGVKVDPVTGKVTLDPQAVKDGSKVEATGKEAGKAESPELDPAPVTKADGTAGAPTVVMDATGPVSATPNATNDLMEVKYHSEDNTGTDPNKTVTVKKVGNDWLPVVNGQTLPKSDTRVYAELPKVNVDPTTGEVTLDKELVKDGSQVTVTVTEGRKDPVTKTDSSGYDEVPQPDIVANADNGFDVTPKPQNVEMTASFPNERDQPQEVKIKKDGDKWLLRAEKTAKHNQ